MINPLGVEQKSVSTQLGNMVYYAPTQAPWPQRDAQDSSPTLMFFHGFGGGSSAYEWSKVYPAFAPDYRVIAPDLIGWGRSQHPEHQYKPKDYLETIREFIEKTSNSPIIAVGSSLTAAYLIRIAIDHPHLFQSLILTTPSGLSDFGNDYSQTFIAQLITTPFVDRFLYTNLLATSAGIEAFLRNRQFGKPERIYPEIVQAYLASAKQPNAEYAALSFVRGDLCFDLALYIPQLTIPTTFIWGDKTQFSNVELGKRLAHLNPECITQFYELKDVGLTPQLEVPALTIGLIRLSLSQQATT